MTLLEFRLRQLRKRVRGAFCRHLLYVCFGANGPVMICFHCDLNMEVTRDFSDFLMDKYPLPEAP